MSIDTLIQQLESAAELATDGEYFSLAGDSDMVSVCGGGSIIAMKVFPDNAQAIAIRHNTSADVLTCLRQLQHISTPPEATP